PLRHDIYTEIGLTYTVIIAGGVTLAALLAYSSPLIGGLGGMALIVFTLVYGTYHQLFLQGVVVGVSYPLLTLSSVFVVVTLFNYCIKDREKRFIQGAFSHYVSPQVVQELVDAPEKLILAGQERELTVFFNDIRGFTSISESMASPELARFLNEYLSAMSDIIMAHQGTVDKYIGDAIMAIWGAPLPDQEHAVHALRAAMAMGDALRKLQPEWSKKGLPAIEIGVGINTGRVSVGNFGSTQRFDYTVIGDNVNLASRLEGLNKIYGTSILLSEPTYEAVKGAFFCQLVDRVRVKGKDRPVAIYQPRCEGEPSTKILEQSKKFEEALGYYQGQNFYQARAILLSLQQEEQSPMYDLYLGRIDAFLFDPPPPDWDGVFTATSK
ncbi:MAG: adenylate/guanylate cyclase domain-containing protein, partial [Proteobacteria bacterium]|nr:adenylate/guanylate cyclase domain-containing protein [Pseudomonadota bacterium]